MRRVSLFLRAHERVYVAYARQVPAYVYASVCGVLVCASLCFGYACVRVLCCIRVSAREMCAAASEVSEQWA